MKNLKFNISVREGFNTNVHISEIGKLKAFNRKEKVYSFLVECERENESIHFIFYNSITFTEKQDNKKQKIGTASGLNEEEIKELVYDILACIGMDYNIEDTDLSEFMASYGYEYSKEIEQLFYRVKEQKVKLHKVFSDEQIACFDENDDILKNYVAGLDIQKINKEQI